MSKVTKKNLLENIIAYESGELDAEQELNLFSHLIKTGQAWTLQGHYGRTARNLINTGLIDSKGTINWNLFGEVLNNNC